MELPAVDYRKMAIGIGVIIAVLLILLIVVPSITNTRTLNAYFEPGGAVRPQSNTTLVVEVVNTDNSDVRTLTVTATAVDPFSVTIGDPQQAQPNVGKGELRRFRFPVRVGEAREGTYSVNVVADLDGKRFEQRASLEVRSG
ncbi:hypothetical protein HY546_02080 [archaeon]|nr:hypothetical protein [archaeon]